jgi:hypothetical protein
MRFQLRVLPFRRSGCAAVQPHGAIECRTLIQDILIEIGMALSRRREADRAATMLVVISTQQFGYSVACCDAGVERLTRTGGRGLQRFEQRSE